MLRSLLTRHLALTRALTCAAISAAFILGTTLPSLVAQQVPSSTADDGTQAASAAIQALLRRQAADWNRGDLEAFATGYKRSPDILFIGSTVQHGYASMLAGYKAHYPNRAAMGTLSFSALEVQSLDAQFATTTGRFHLERSAAAGGNADGYFLLVVEHTPEGWKIVRDDTTAQPATP